MQKIPNMAMAMHFSGYKGEKIFLIQPLRGVLGQKWRKQTPLKWPIFSIFFTFSQKCLFTELEPSQVQNLDAILLLLHQFSEKIHFWTFLRTYFRTKKCLRTSKFEIFFIISTPYRPPLTVNRCTIHYTHNSQTTRVLAGLAFVDMNVVKLSVLLI